VTLEFEIQKAVEHRTCQTGAMPQLAGIAERKWEPLAGGQTDFWKRLGCIGSHECCAWKRRRQGVGKINQVGSVGAVAVNENDEARDRLARLFAGPVKQLHGLGISRAARRSAS